MPLSQSGDCDAIFINRCPLLFLPVCRLPFFPFPQCAKSYLSVVPGKFLLFDNMKDAERLTYTFIAEMEEGGMDRGID